MKDLMLHKNLLKSWIEKFSKFQSGIPHASDKLLQMSITKKDPILQELNYHENGRN